MILSGSHYALALGDSVETLRALAPLSVDHVITDPPYSPRVHDAHRVSYNDTFVEPNRPNARRAQMNRSKDLGFDAITPELRWACAEQFSRITKRWVLVFSDHEGSDAWKADLEAAGLVEICTCLRD